MIISTTKTIAKLPHLTTFLADSPRAVAGWGRKASGRRAILLAKFMRRPLALLEDGFIRSVERDSPLVSLIVDRTGVYYDSHRPSCLERNIAQGLTEDQARRAAKLVDSWRLNRVSKYNDAPEFEGPLLEPYVLVVDQTFGDLSIAGGMAEATSFARMLDAALAENPRHNVLVKVHPDVLDGRKRGYFSLDSLKHPRIRIIGTRCHPVRLLANADAVYAVTSLMGFEAMIWGKPVRCFGMPFYAGWGVTVDELRPPQRRGPATIGDIVHAALVESARYVDPDRGVKWEAENALAHVGNRRGELYGTSRDGIPPTD